MKNNKIINNIFTKKRKPAPKSKTAMSNTMVIGNEAAKTLATPPTNNKKKRKVKKQRNPKLVFAGRLITSVFLISIITGSLVSAAFIYYLSTLDRSFPFDLNSLEENDVTIVNAYPNGDTTQEAKQLQVLQGQKKITINYEDLPHPVAAEGEKLLPGNLEFAAVAAEDVRFYEHHGIDWRRTFGAIYATIFKDDKQGGSTITMQLIKNLTLEEGSQTRDIKRKLTEFMQAYEIENIYSKDTIMLNYLNLLPLGYGLVGVEAGAQYYFGVSTKELTLAQCASLIAITKSPTYYDPILEPENSKVRQTYILNTMLEEEFITKAEYDAAIVEDIKIIKEGNTITKGGGQPPVNSYFIDLLILEVMQDLKDNLNITQKAAENLVYNGGLSIYSTIDPTIQASLEAVYNDPDNFPNLYDAEADKYVESAMVVMDYQGHIIADVGGRNPKDKSVNLALNRSHLPTGRQPGSSIKPLSVYGPALEKDYISYSTLISDTPSMEVDEEPWPTNYGGGYTSNNVTTAYAIQKSLNTTAVRVLDMIGLQQSLDYVTGRLGFTTLDPATELTYSGLALGGTTEGVRVTEMAAAYTTFGNGGRYNEPTTYTKVTRMHNGFAEDVLTQKPDKTGFSPDTAYIMNQMTQLVVEAGTGTGAQIGSWPIYGKTGTTSDNRDRWFAGGNPYYVGVVWLGFDEESFDDNGNSLTPQVTGDPASSIWRKVMTQALAEKEMKDFVKPDTVVYTKYDPTTGKLATEGCPSTESGWFKTSDKNYCEHGGSPLDGGVATSNSYSSTSSLPSSSQSSSSIPVPIEPPSSTPVDPPSYSSEEPPPPSSSSGGSQVIDFPTD